MQQLDQEPLRARIFNKFLAALIFVKKRTRILKHYIVMKKECYPRSASKGATAPSQLHPLQWPAHSLNPRLCELRGHSPVYFQALARH